MAMPFNKGLMAMEMSFKWTLLKLMSQNSYITLSNAIWSALCESCNATLKCKDLSLGNYLSGESVHKSKGVQLQG